MLRMLSTSVAVAAPLVYSKKTNPRSGAGELARTAGQFVAAVPANAYSGRYPLARFLWVSVNYKPGSKLDPLRAEFIRLVFPSAGVFVQNGFEYGF